jgi:methionyl-tRNA formyltransferase
MRLVFMGSPEFAVLPLRCLVQEGHEVAAVYTKIDKPAGRGMALGISPSKREAVSMGLTVIQPKSLKQPEAQAQLAAFHPDVVIVCAYGQLLPKAVLEMPKHGCLNIHPSLLPRHRGASPVASTILSGDVWGGSSIMLMDEGLDTGPVLTRARVLVREDDTTGELMPRLSLISAQLLADVLPRWVKGQIIPQPQDPILATYIKPLTREAGEIDWSLPAIDIWRKVRAFQPWPGTYTRFQGRLLKVLAARLAAPDTGCLPGVVVAFGKGFGITAGVGVLEILKVQIEGKQAVSGEEFARGQRNLIGTRLPS